MKQTLKKLNVIANLITTITLIVGIVYFFCDVKGFIKKYDELCKTVTEISEKFEILTYHEANSNGIDANVGINKNVATNRARFFKINQFDLSDGDYIELTNLNDDRTPTIKLRVETIKRNNEENTDADFTINYQNLKLIGKSNEQIEKIGIFKVKIKVIKKIK